LTADQELSCFFVRELFPLKSEGTLDSARKKKIESHLATCKECKSYYDKLEKARTTIMALAGTKPTAAMIDYLKAEHHFWIDSIKRLGWSSWPATLKWAVELSLVTVGLILTVHYFPWLGLARTVQNMRPQAPVVVAASTPVPEPEVTPVVTAATAIPGLVTVAQATAAPQVVAANPKPVSESSKDEEENSQTAGVVPNEAEQKMAGFVWRGSLKVEELNDDLAQRVTKVITDLGGTKAGQVELGYHQGQQRYYHFILPEENYEKFLSVLNEEGIVQLTKERHPRVIRSGHMRIIMTVEESKE
jgi:hypothetical protein